MYKLITYHDPCPVAENHTIRMNDIAVFHCHLIGPAGTQKACMPHLLQRCNGIYRRWQDALTADQCAIHIKKEQLFFHAAILAYKYFTCIPFKTRNAMTIVMA